MGASDTRPIPLKGTAYRLYFPIQNSSGALVSGAAGLDSEVSIDAGAFADCTNEATEIGTSGWYYLDLTAGEMNGDSICISVKTSTSGALTTPIWLMPAEDSDIRVDVVRVSGDATAADNLESFMDGTGYAGTNNTIPNVTTVSTVSGSVASVTAAVTVGTNNDKTGYGLSSTAVQAIWDALTSALTTSGSVGKRIVDNLDATISSRLATSGYTVPPTVTQVRTEMDTNSTKLANLDATVSSRSTLTAADVWNALLSGMSTAGSVGKRISDNIDATVSSRLATSGYTAPPSAPTIAFAVWNESTRTLTSFGTLIADIWSNVSRTLTSAGAGGGATAQEIWEYEERTLTSATEQNAVGFANYQRCRK